MALKFYWYPNCGTCKKAKKWFDDNQIDYYSIHIVNETPSSDQIQNWMSISESPAKKFFNTSGKKYRELNIKDKVNQLSEKEIADLLSSDGMLIKRPIVTDGKNITIGYKEDTFEKVWK